MKSTEFIQSQRASEDQLLSVNRKKYASNINCLQNDKLILDEEEDGLTPEHDPMDLAANTEKEHTP